MSIFAIGDLHLPGGDMKPMDVFGSHWENHFEKIADNWRRRVKPRDVVLLPGDISWAMHLADALPVMMIFDPLFFM
jgi:predicted phosphohydrolase